MSTPPDSTPIDLARRVISTLPLSQRTSAANTNSPSFHVIKLPALDRNVDRLRHLVVEYCIQPLAQVNHQAVWWTAYVVLARLGTLTRATGVYTEWSEFGTVSSHPAIGIVSSRTSGILIADIRKGVSNGPGPSNGTVLQQVDLSSTSNNLEIFALLVATGMHDGGYQVHGQARLEYRIRDNR